MIFNCFSFVLRRSRIRPGYLVSMKQNRYKQQYAHSKQYVAGHPCSSFFLCTHGKNQGCWPTTLLLYRIFNFQLGKGSSCTLKKLPGIWSGPELYLPQNPSLSTYGTYRYYCY